MTFSRNVAPIIFNHCAPCHRPGLVAPFTLLTYSDVRKHAKDIVKVTGDRYMPPWLPEPGCGEFAGERRLTTNQVNTLRQWDFNWQDDYRYRQPVSLPKGATLTMQWTYNNSDANVRNPNHPPRRVTYGPQSSDEMGELWLQVLPRDARDLPVLQREYHRLGLEETVAYYETVLRQNPANASAHNELGKALGPLGREPEALAHFQRALELAPASAEPHYYLGLIHLNRQNLSQAQAEFENALRADPDYYRAYDGLGLVSLVNGDPASAEKQYRSALRLNPDDPIARGGLDRALQLRQRSE